MRQKIRALLFHALKTSADSRQGAAQGCSSAFLLKHTAGLGVGTREQGRGGSQRWAWLRIAAQSLPLTVRLLSVTVAPGNNPRLI